MHILTLRQVNILLEGFFAALSGILLLTSGIESNNSFPHPLSPEKEKYYLERFQAGDISARDTLVKHNLRLIVYIAKKYTNYPDKDELISVGTIGLIKAVTLTKVTKALHLQLMLQGALKMKYLWLCDLIKSVKTIFHFTMKLEPIAMEIN